MNLNNYLYNLKSETNYGLTENGAVKHNSTLNKVLDMFAFGGAYRKRSDDDCIHLFVDAYTEDPILALKCLFYLRDCRGGQGERRFFRVCMHWLAQTFPEKAKELISIIPEYGRYDDWLCLLDTKVANTVLENIRNQLTVDMSSEKNGISLLAKWLPSENCSNKQSIAYAKKIRKYLGITSKQYRQMLSKLRAKINVLERLMSANEWEKIEFDSIPSKAGLIYRNAFARRDVIAAKYKAFAESAETKVHADTLYPQEIAAKAWYYNFKNFKKDLNDPDRLMLQKYWDNLPNYYGDKEENAIAVVDVSGSMYGTPMDAAIALGAYVAEKSHGPFANHFITFSSRPQLVEFEGFDIVDKFIRARGSDWGYNTNIEAVFDLLLNTALKNDTPKEDMPAKLYVFSDMEFDQGLGHPGMGYKINTLIEKIEYKWMSYGYELPKLIFWNLDARHNNISALGEKFSYVSGFSPVMIENVLKEKSSLDLMLDKLNSERYNAIEQAFA